MLNRRITQDRGGIQGMGTRDLKLRGVQNGLKLGGIQDVLKWAAPGVALIPPFLMEVSRPASQCIRFPIGFARAELNYKLILS